MESLAYVRSSAKFVMPEHKTNLDRIFHAIENDLKEATQLVQIKLLEHCEMEEGVIKTDDQGPFFKSKEDCEKFDETLADFFSHKIRVKADKLKEIWFHPDYHLSPVDKENLSPIFE